MEATRSFENSSVYLIYRSCGHTRSKKCYYSGDGQSLQTRLVRMFSPCLLKCKCRTPYLITRTYERYVTTAGWKSFNTQGPLYLFHKPHSSHTHPVYFPCLILYVHKYTFFVASIYCCEMQRQQRHANADKCYEFTLTSINRYDILVESFAY